MKTHRVIIKEKGKESRIVTLQGVDQPALIGQPFVHAGRDYQFLENKKEGVLCIGPRGTICYIKGIRLKPVRKPRKKKNDNPVNLFKETDK